MKYTHERISAGLLGSNGPERSVARWPVTDPPTAEPSTKPAVGADGDRLVEEAATHAIFRLDPGGYIATWPRPAVTLYAYDAETAVGNHVRTLLADRAAGGAGESPADFLTDASSGPIEVQHWHERADGSVFWGSLTVSPLSADAADGYVAVCQDETEKKEYERMLERQNDRLKEFTDILAHDLRNPLNVIEGHLEMYESTGEASHLETVGETTARMGRLVEDLLQVAKQGVVIEDPEPVEIESVAQTAWAGTGQQADASLVCESIRTVGADRDRLCELFENLFRNAVEHAGSDVTVRVGPSAAGFYIEDDGPGIPSDQRTQVFDHGHTTRDDGSGYGLSIVRTIVNAHGWDVRVTDGQDGGARFEITGIEFLEESTGPSEG